MKPAIRRKPGRPPKFGCPSQLVALTLPQPVVSKLRRIHSDLAWAIVTLVERGPVPRPVKESRHANAALTTVAERRSLIVVNRAVFQKLPGVDIIPLNSADAFLALAPGRGMSDLELAVIDRIDDGTASPRERKALFELRGRLRGWRRDSSLRFHCRSIIVVERLAKDRKASTGGRRKSTD